MKKIIISLCLILVIFSFVLYKQQEGKTNHVEVNIGTSTKFTEEEIHDAIGSVEKKFQSFKGCELTDLWYSEKRSNEFIKDYLKYGAGSKSNVNAGNIIVLLSNFNVDASGGDGSFEPKSTQSEWNCIIIRDSKTDNWRVDDWGY